eukprot:866601-Pleurochrysis_carterae.AAC.1
MAHEATKRTRGSSRATYYCRSLGLPNPAGVRTSCRVLGCRVHAAGAAVRAIPSDRSLSWCVSAERAQT